MNLKEFEGRALFEKYGIEVPKGFVSADAADAYIKAAIFARKLKVSDFLLKAQLQSGKRGKSGAIVESTLKFLKKDFANLQKKIFSGEKVKEILVSEKISIKKEFYLGITVDRFRRCPVLIFSRCGGVDIEEAVNKSPRSVKKIYITNIDNFNGFAGNEFFSLLKGFKLGKKLQAELKLVAARLFELFIKEDCLLAEINPLILSSANCLFAADAKIVFDGESLFRHKERIKKALDGLSALEKRAHKYGLAYVELDGDVAIMGNGAGLVMSTLDMVANCGIQPANFCDVGGGASSLMVEEALKVVLKKKMLKGIFINIFGGITRCDLVAQGLLDFLKKNKFKIPFVVRLTGTNQKKAIAMLKKKDIKASGSFGLQAFDSFAAAVNLLKKIK